jgi:hypothetical protein
MKFLPVLLVAAASVVAHAQGAPTGGTRIYRCGNSYTNDAVEAQAKGCKPLEGGNITVVPGTRVQQAPPRSASALPGPSANPSPAPASGGSRVDSAEPRARDADARYILESELKKAESRRAELLREYNNGEPEKLGPETRNHQKYLDRVAELKAAISRSDADVAGIQRELSRLSASK